MGGRGTTWSKKDHQECPKGAALAKERSRRGPSERRSKGRLELRTRSRSQGRILNRSQPSPTRSPEPDQTGTADATPQHRPQDKAGQQEEAGGGPGGGGGPRGGRQEQQESGKKKVNVLYTNARSLIGKISELEVTAEDLKPDVILICES